MQSWLKYSLAFFAFALLLSGFIYVLGPSSTREAAMSGQTQTGQIMDPNATLKSAGEGKVPSDTESATSQPADVKAADQADQKAAE